jgi:hypothetical protein
MGGSIFGQRVLFMSGSGAVRVGPIVAFPLDGMWISPIVERTAALGAFRVAALAATVIIPFPALCSAQTSEPTGKPALTLDSAPQPITPQERREWLAEGILAPKSLGAGVMIGTWQTAIGWPKEWQGSSGVTKRVLTSQADNAISKSIEATLGGMWGEDPRPRRSGRDRLGSRLGYAMKTVVLAQRPDGHLAPAWGRFAGIVGSNVVQNAWLPPSVTTAKGTSARVATGLLGRLTTNLWEEFGPALRRRFPRGLAGRPIVSREPAPAAIPSTQLELTLLQVAAPAF